MAGNPVEGEVGYGSFVEIALGGGSYVAIDGLFDFTPPAVTIANVESPQMNLPENAMLRIAGKVKNYGQATFGLVWLPGGQADALIDDMLDEGAAFGIRITYPSGAYWEFDGLIASATPATPWDDRMTCSVVCDTTGVVDKTAAAAPSNSLKPAISGVLTVGETLFAWPGAWAGATSFTYQWKNAGVNISGATSQTYVLQAGDSGDAITVAVTGTNSEGSATATSAAVVIG